MSGPALECFRKGVVWPPLCSFAHPSLNRSLQAPCDILKRLHSSNRHVVAAYAWPDCPASSRRALWRLHHTQAGMGYGSYLVWKECGGFTKDAVAPLGLYGLQLSLNWAWTPIFFGAHKLKMALIEIVILTGAVGATMASWYPVNHTASLLLTPYLAWLCLATSLNYCIWRDNPDDNGKEE
ncbi:hypothetical protein J4Q44_G00081320 [Coregonus suidteri]|uniref:Translocator protein n=1 Tax=Coregonus suidteri TaxID=861788 RepID=A0AAN8R1Q1_9TELE